MFRLNFWLVFVALFVIPLAFYAPTSHALVNPLKKSQIPHIYKRSPENVVAHYASLPPKKLTVIQSIQKKRIMAYIVAKLFSRNLSKREVVIAPEIKKGLLITLNLFIDSIVTALANIKEIKERNLQDRADKGEIISPEEHSLMLNLDEAKEIAESVASEVLKRLMNLFIDLVTTKAEQAFKEALTKSN